MSLRQSDMKNLPDQSNEVSEKKPTHKPLHDIRYLRDSPEDKVNRARSHIDTLNNIDDINIAEYLRSKSFAEQDIMNVQGIIRVAEGYDKKDIYQKQGIESIWKIKYSSQGSEPFKAAIDWLAEGAPNNSSGRIEKRLERLEETLPSPSPTESFLNAIVNEIEKNKIYKTGQGNMYPTMTKALNALKKFAYQHNTNLSEETKQGIAILCEQMTQLRDYPKGDSRMKETARNFYSSLKWYYSNNISNSSIVNAFTEEIGINSDLFITTHSSDYSIHHKQQISGTLEKPSPSEESPQSDAIIDGIIHTIIKNRIYRKDQDNIYPTMTKAINALKNINKNNTNLSEETKQGIAILCEQMTQLRDYPKGDSRMKETARNFYYSLEWYYSNNISNSPIVNAFTEEIGINPNSWK